jgi:hypothetical protein
MRLVPPRTSCFHLMTLSVSRPHSGGDRMINACGAVGGMRIGRGNRSTRRYPTQVPLSPPQITYYLTRDRPRAAVARTQLLTAWGMARLIMWCLSTELIPSLPDPRSTPGCSGKNSATNRLRYGTTYHVVIKHWANSIFTLKNQYINTSFNIVKLPITRLHTEMATADVGFGTVP